MTIHPKHKKQIDKWIDSGLKGNLYLEDIENPVPVVRTLGKNEELLDSEFGDNPLNWEGEGY